MFGRKKKKITFKDWALIMILGDVARGPELDIDMAKVAAIESMKFGGAVGAQCPTKVMPVLRQVSGADTENAYAQMKESLQSWVDANSDTGIELDSFPLIAQTIENMQVNRFNGLTRGQVITWATGTFFYGLLMGRLHREFFLEVLKSSIRYENLRWELAKEHAPRELKSEPEPTFDVYLADIREMVARYEKEQGTLL